MNIFYANLYGHMCSFFLSKCSGVELLGRIVFKSICNCQTIFRSVLWHYALLKTDFETLIFFFFFFGPALGREVILTPGDQT